MPAEIIVLRHPSAPGWHICVEFAADGRTVGFALTAPAEHVTWPDEAEAGRVVPTGGLTAAAIRKVPFAELERDARYYSKCWRQLDITGAAQEWNATDNEGAIVASGAIVDGGGPLGPLTLRARKLAAAMEGPDRKPGPQPSRNKPKTLAELSRFAHRWEGLTDTEHAPVQTLAKLEHMSVDAVKSKLGRAVAAGILTPGHGGRVSRRLTDYGRSLLPRAEHLGHD